MVGGPLNDRANMFFFILTWKFQSKLEDFRVVLTPVVLPPWVQFSNQETNKANTSIIEKRTYTPYKNGVYIKIYKKTEQYLLCFACKIYCCELRIRFAHAYKIIYRLWKFFVIFLIIVFKIQKIFFARLY